MSERAERSSSNENKSGVDSGIRALVRLLCRAIYLTDICTSTRHSLYFEPLTLLANLKKRFLIFLKSFQHKIIYNTHFLSTRIIYSRERTITEVIMSVLYVFKIMNTQVLNCRKETPHHKC